MHDAAPPPNEPTRSRPLPAALEGLKRPWRILLVHHTHTDVGYTQSQSRVRRLHAEFNRTALDWARTGKVPGFKWTCETFWSVEQFLATASAEEKAAFADAVRSGGIGLSATYLHFSELAGLQLQRHALRRAVEFGASIGHRVTAALSADVNGFGRGSCQAFSEAGVRNLLTCIHTHHGMLPAGGAHSGFWWQPNDASLEPVLVWNSAHYQLGNEFGFAPGAPMTYTLRGVCDVEDEQLPPHELTLARLPAYLKRLEAEGYPYSFLPLMVSGLVTDNAPPSVAIAENARDWNAQYGAAVAVEMATLEEVFDALRAEPQTANLPVYEGDWPDWWTDGTASTPRAVRLFRQAQRDWERLHRLRDAGEPIDAQTLRAVEDDLLLFAEHTWGHSESMLLPWHFEVQSVGARKRLHAVRAQDVTEEALDRWAHERHGGELLRTGRAWRFKAFNTEPHALHGIAEMFLEHFEYGTARADELQVEDEASGESLPCQVREAPRGILVSVPLALQPEEERLLRLIRSTPEAAADSGTRAADGVADVRTRSSVPAPALCRATEHGIETPFVRIEWAEGRGIVAWDALDAKRSLIDSSAPHGPLAAIRDLTPLAVPPGDDRERIRERTRMGRNRKLANVERSVSRLTGVRMATSGPAFARAELAWDLPGTTLCRLVLTAHAAFPRVDVALRLNKDALWDPENLYLSLPFAANGDGEGALWIDKPGGSLRPWRDQLPGTLTDYHAVQEGFAVCDDDFGVAVAMRDGPLLQLGPLEWGERLLAGDPRLEKRKPRPHAWLMTNYWETNFEASLAGFHEFRFSVLWGRALADPAQAMEACRAANRGIPCLRLG